MLLYKCALVCFFVFSVKLTENKYSIPIKVSQWLDSNIGSLMSQATNLPLPIKNVKKCPSSIRFQVWNSRPLGKCVSFHNHKTRAPAPKMYCYFSALRREFKLAKWNFIWKRVNDGVVALRMLLHNFLIFGNTASKFFWILLGNFAFKIVSFSLCLSFCSFIKFYFKAFSTDRQFCHNEIFRYEDV